MTRVYPKLYELMLQEAYSVLEERVKEAFYTGYQSAAYYYDDRISNPNEEWEKYRAVLVN